MKRQKHFGCLQSTYKVSDTDRSIEGGERLDVAQGSMN